MNQVTRQANLQTPGALRADTDRLAPFAEANARPASAAGVSRWSRCWPVLVALLALWVTVGCLLAVSLGKTQGRLVYALDDPYIHMAMAKNLARHGVWGVTPYGFTSSSSSLLWTALIGLTYRVFHVSAAMPFVLNIIFSAALLLLLDALLAAGEIRPVARLIVLVATIYFAPLPVLIFAGLEHNLHAALVLLVVYLACAVLIGREQRHTRIGLIALAPLATSTRPESIFLIGVIGGLMLVQRRWTLAVTLTCAAVAPWLLYGIISVRRGWLWLPDPVLLKGLQPNFDSPIDFAISIAAPLFMHLQVALHLSFIVLASAFVYIFAFERRVALWDARQVMAAIFVPTALLHLGFADAGWFYRYEAYLVTLGILTLALQLTIWAPGFARLGWTPSVARARYVAAGALAALLIFPLALRGLGSLVRIPQATKNIFEQQYQMGLFTQRYYQASSIALNDIGAVNFLADVHCLDLWGLANVDVAREKRARTYQTGVIEILAQRAGARVAFVYDHWFQDETGGLPRAWVRVGQWTIQKNVVTGGATVSIYATSQAEVKQLRLNLRDFTAQLPADVLQSGDFAIASESP